MYRGTTKIWDLPQAEEPIVLPPSVCLGFFLKYIYELQQMIYETKASKTAILDLLKNPSQDKSLQKLFSVFAFEFP